MKLNKGEVLFRQGEAGPLYHLKSGLLKIVRLKEDGHSSLVNLLVPGETFPHHSLLSPKEYFGTGIVLIPCEVERIPREQWYASLNHNPQQMHEIASILEEKLRMMQQRIDQLTAVSPLERLELFQAWFQRYFPAYHIADILTQDEIGQFIGLRRETVNRLLKQHPFTP